MGLTGFYSFLTIHYMPLMLNKPVHNFEGLRTARLNLIQGESIQPLQDSLDRAPSEKYFRGFACVVSSQSTILARTRLT